MGIGNKIKKRRTELGMSQEELAKKMGYSSRSTINKIELNINDVSQSKIVKFAEILDTSIAFLMDWEEEMKKENEQYHSPTTPQQKANMQKRTLDDIKGFFDEDTYNLLVNYLDCSDEGKRWANDRLVEAVKLYPNGNK